MARARKPKSLVRRTPAAAAARPLITLPDNLQAALVVLIADDYEYVYASADGGDMTPIRDALRRMDDPAE